MRIRFASFAFALISLFVVSRADAQMSDTERKSAARAAYTEGVKLQDEGKYQEALRSFESAQKFYDAPTHLLHIAECQALTGRLVEGVETYELLARKQLPAGSPDAFVQAQQQGQAELPALRARVPTLRITTRPEASQLQGLQVNVNGVSMPIELLGIPRPLNPGVYRFSAQAQGWGTEKPVDVPLAEKEQKSYELVLVQRAGGPAVVAAPVPAPYTGQTQDIRKDKPETEGPTPMGLLLGVRGGAFVPAGNVTAGEKMSDFVTAGGGFGIDAYFRVVKMLLLGGTFEYAALGTAATIPGVTGNFETSASTTYGGFNIGIVPNVDKTSFIGDLGIGSRSLNYKATPLGTLGATNATKISTSGLEFGLGLGVSIPAGPIRIVPKANLTVGSFSSLERTVGPRTVSGDIASVDKGTHVFFFVGINIYYSLGFGGSKPAAGDPSATAAAPAQ